MFYSVGITHILFVVHFRFMLVFLCRFKISGIQQEKNTKYVAVYLESLPPKYTNWNEWESERKVREKLASYAYQYQFEDAINLIKTHKTSIPDLVNSTRPDSSKFWTIGHQIKHSKKEDADQWIAKIHQHGFWDGARDNTGKTIYNINKSESGCILM